MTAVPEVATTMNDLLAEQQALIHSITRALDNFKKLGKNNYTAAMVRARIASTKEVWTQCLRVHSALLQAIPEAKRSTLDYFKNKLFDQADEIHLKTLDYMAECLEELAPMPPLMSANQVPGAACSHGSSASSFSLLHLPPNNIPSFSGKYEEWEMFRDRFMSLIINNHELSANARMHFLWSSLTGRAFESIRSIPITGDNFEIAWKTLEYRYENKRRLVEMHVSALYNLPSVSRESASELNELRDKANRAIASLKNLDRSETDILSDMLVYSVTQKMDPATRKVWELKGGDDARIPTYYELDRFLDSRARALEELNPANVTKQAHWSKVTSATASYPITRCPLCRAPHFLNKCQLFINKNPSQRLEAVKKTKRCINCLSARHTVQWCSSNYSCRICQKRHHSMLHVNSDTSAATASITDAARITSLFSTAKVSSMPPVLLATARVRVSFPSEPPNGRARVVRALLDQGSEMTFITERLRQGLKLRRVRMPVSISAIGGVDARICRYAAEIQISPLGQSSLAFKTIASVMKSLTKYTPSPVTSPVQWSHVADLGLADPDPTNSDSIDVIIGADLYGDLLLDGIRKGSRGQPLAQNTVLGWVLSGPATDSQARPRTVTAQHCSNSPSLDEELRRFWEIEEIPRARAGPLSPEEQQCEDHFLATHWRRSDGRYVIRFPFKTGPPIEIGDSYNSAERQLRGLERRLNADERLATEYRAFIEEYERLEHIKRVPADASASSQCVYIPHHPVIRESSTTTRLRVVFNASNSTSNGTSLNDHLLTGQKLQTDLAAVLLRWLLPRYVYSADITKMYRQIEIDPRDVNYQRILWLDRETRAIIAFLLLVLTYGTVNAPHDALRVLEQLVRDEGGSFPLAIPVVRKCRYIDNFLFGADDIPLLRQTRDQVCALLSRGRFELRKWASNSPKLLTDIDIENHGLACSKMLQADEQLKVLGISWNPALDVFQFDVSLPPSVPKTKRSILSLVAKIFDPLGWVTPVTINAKIFLQQLWEAKVEWDEAIADKLLAQWETIHASLAAINGLHVDRWVQYGSDTANCELHGFCNASSTAFAAAVYIRITSLTGETTSRLLVAKSKVAPIKSLSIPQLGLSAAVLLARLLEFVRSSLQLTAIPCFCWTNALVVLACVTQHPSRWKTFVSNHVSEIQSRIPFVTWKHVPTEDNPADCASRGILGCHLASHHLWWQGPSWLRLPKNEWPAQREPSSHDRTLEQNLRITTYIAKPIERWDLMARYSSWPKLIRVTAYILRFISRTRRIDANVSEASPLALSADECQSARNFWLRRIQEEEFPVEREALLSRKTISSKMIRQMTERFWKLWQTDYVNTLQQRAKWRRTGKERIQVGQLVLLRNPLLPPCKWELGRIIQCHAGSDDVVRVVTVKTATSVYKRPVVKICLLPIDNAEKPA
ncbi:uncharacterized protein [Temnothorax nylanderi]|uniref:uncharacterized protein n=1 Tax=Temnothorax nylanderi TaxID=102681 RepID=UPI003A888513